MVNQHSMNAQSLVWRGLLVLVVLAATAGPKDVGAAEVIELTQVGCQFIESEDVDHGYKTTKKADCDAINARTAKDRLTKAKALELKAGTYTFRVTNKNVPYELGFWLRSKGYDWKNPIDQLTKTSISGGGMVLGKTQDYEVTLKAGEYVYSCPLNTTPDYRLVVTGG